MRRRMTNFPDDQKPNHRTPAQDEGYDEAARGGKGVPPSDVGVPLDPDDHLGGKETDPAARDTAGEVPRRDRPAH